MADDAVIVKGGDNTYEEEGVAGGAITPGHLLDETSAGTYVVHATAAGAAGPVFAGLPIDPSKDKADAYAADEQVRVHYCAPGTVVDAIASAAITAGDYVVSDGAGAVQTATPGTDAPGSLVGVALEAAAAGGDRVQVRVL